MNANRIRWIFLPTLLAAALNSHAGSPRGLRLLVIPTDAAKAHLAPIDAFFQAHGPDQGPSCADGLMNIEAVSFAESRHKITPALAVEATTNARQRARLTKILASWRDKAHPTGFDGALVVDARGGQVELFGFSADGSAKPFKATLALSAMNARSTLEKAMCRALVELPVLEEP